LGVHPIQKGDVAVSAAVTRRKALLKKSAPKKATTARKAAPKVLKKAAPKKAMTPRNAAPKMAATTKQAVLGESTKVENLGGEVPRKFTMTIQVSGNEYLADPVAATRRVLILALTIIPAKIHEEQVDNGSIYKGMFNKQAEIHFNGVLNDPKNPTAAADLHSPNKWQWQPADR
jgi:hypothetical protein